MIAYIEAQGSLLTMKVMGRKYKRPYTGGIRSRIRSFSAKSRVRLMRFMARLKMSGVRATFMTLTFKGYPTNAEAKRCLHAFVQHIRRNFPTASAVWRMEFQVRGSIHFHLLCFDLPYWDWKEILKTWKGITHQDVARIDVRLVRSRRGVMSYVSKYIAKVDKGHRKTFFISPPYLHGGRKWRKGRFWGYHNKKGLPLGEKVAGVLTSNSTINRLSDAAWEIIGAATRFNSISFSLFHDHSTSLAMRNIEQGGMFLDEWKWSQVMTPREQRDVEYTSSRFSEAELKEIKVEVPSFKSRPRSARSVQPCTSSWTRRGCFVGSASGGLSFGIQLQ